MLGVQSYGEREGVCLQGDAEGGTLLSALLRQCLQADVPLETGDESSSSAQWLSSIVLRPTECERVLISESNDGRSLVIAFSAHHSDLLAYNIAEVLIDSEPEYHRHEEYHPDHFYLDEGSVPLVVQRV